MKALANGKSLSPNEIIVEFYKYFWYLIREDFLKMIQEIVKVKSLPMEWIGVFSYNFLAKAL